MNRKVPNMQKRNRRGTTTVEFAIVAPMFFLFLIGTIELWRLNMLVNTANQATFQVARAGSVIGADLDELPELAVATMADLGATITQEDVIVTTSAAGGRELLTVEVEINLAQNAWVVPHFYLGPKLHATSTMAREVMNSG